jgi:hypothetical protein
MQIYLLQNTVGPILMPPVLALVYLEFYQAPQYITGLLGTQLDSWAGYAVLFANAALEYWMDLQYWVCLCGWCQVMLIGLHTVKLTTNLTREGEEPQACLTVYREMQAYMAALSSYYSKATLPLTLTLLTLGITFLICGMLRFPGVISPGSYSLFPSAVVNLALVSFILHEMAGGAVKAGQDMQKVFRRSRNREVRMYARSLPLRMRVANIYWINTNTMLTFFDFIIDRTVDIFLLGGFKVKV